MLGCNLQTYKEAFISSIAEFHCRDFFTMLIKIGRLGDLGIYYYDLWWNLVFFCSMKLFHMKNPYLVSERSQSNCHSVLSMKERFPEKSYKITKMPILQGYLVMSVNT